MSNFLFLIDKKVSYIGRKRNLKLLNLYQLYIQRYGIGDVISRRIAAFTGTHPSFKVNSISYNCINKDIALYLKKKESFFDEALKRITRHVLEKEVDIRSYKGRRYLLKLPLHGQRRRTNANTCKRIRPLDTTKLIRHAKKPKRFNKK